MVLSKKEIPLFICKRLALFVSQRGLSSRAGNQQVEGALRVCGPGFVCHNNGGVTRAPSRWRGAGRPTHSGSPKTDTPFTQPSLLASGGSSVRRIHRGFFA